MNDNLYELIVNDDVRDYYKKNKLEREVISYGN